MAQPHMPTLGELMEAIENMKGLSDEDREELMKSLSNQNGNPGVPAPLPEPPYTHQAMVLTLMLLLLVLIFEEKEDVTLDTLFEGLKGIGKKAGMGSEDLDQAGGMLDRLISGYGKLSEEEKSEFRKNAQEKLMSRMQEALSSHVTKAYFQKIGILALCVIVLLCIFVFFGYKLIKNIKEKERKREEKKKQKQSKKKK